LAFRPWLSHHEAYGVRSVGYRFPSLEFDEPSQQNQTPEEIMIQDFVDRQNYWFSISMWMALENLGLFVDQYMPCKLNNLFF